MQNRFRQFFIEHPTWKVKVDGVIAEGDKVAVRLAWFEEGKKTHKGLSYYHLSNGKIVDDWFCSTKIEE